jgi:hypothetical protein
MSDCELQIFSTLEDSRGGSLGTCCLGVWSYPTVICEYKWMEEPEELGRIHLPTLSLVRSMETMAGNLWKRRME